MILTYQQRLWLVLPVNVHKTLAQRSQCTDGDDVPVDTILVPAGTVYLARRHDGHVVVRHEVAQHIPL